MKRILLSLVAATIVLSCSSDDSSGGSGSISGNIYGTWELRKEGVMVGNNPVLENMSFMAPCTEYDRMTYSQNGIWTQRYYYGSGGSCSVYSDNGTFTYENGVITHIEESEYYPGEGKYEIIELTNTRMVYKYYDSYYESYSENPWRVKYYVKAN